MQNGWLSLLTLDARTSYPWPLAWGNAFWGYVAYKMYRRGLPKNEQPGFTFGVLLTFVFYTMPANIFTNLLVLSRTPSALTNINIIPFHLTACALVQFVPGLFDLLSGTVMLTVIDSLGVLDNVTTGFNFLEQAYANTQSPFAAIIAATVTNLAGGIARHFVANGYVKGSVTFDKFGINLLYALAVNGLYFWQGVSSQCDPLETVGRNGRKIVHGTCAAADFLYMALPIICMLKNLLQIIMPLLAAPAKKTKKM